MPQAITELARSTILSGGMAPDKFVAVLTAFGPLPGEGQLVLAERLVGGVGVYRLRVRMKGSQPAKERDQLKGIAQAADSLLEHLGVDDPQALGTCLVSTLPYTKASAWLLPVLYHVAQERRPEAATLGAFERWRAFLLLLSDLKEAAERSTQMAAQRSTREGNRRGGKRRKGPDSKGELLQKLFETYAALRLRYPESGPALACDKGLRDFVRAGLSIAMSSAPPIVGPDGKPIEMLDKACGPDLTKKARPTDAAIRKAFERWLRQTKVPREDGMAAANPKRPK